MVRTQWDPLDSISTLTVFQKPKLIFQKPDGGSAFFETTKTFIVRYNVAYFGTYYVTCNVTRRVTCYVNYNVTYCVTYSVSYCVTY